MDTFSGAYDTPEATQRKLQSLKQQVEDVDAMKTEEAFVLVGIKLRDFIIEDAKLLKNGYLKRVNYFATLKQNEEYLALEKRLAELLKEMIDLFSGKSGASLLAHAQERYDNKSFGNLLRTSLGFDDMTIPEFFQLLKNQDNLVTLGSEDVWCSGERFVGQPICHLLQQHEGIERFWTMIMQALRRMDKRKVPKGLLESLQEYLVQYHAERLKLIEQIQNIPLRYNVDSFMRLEFLAEQATPRPGKELHHEMRQHLTKDATQLKQAALVVIGEMENVVQPIAPKEQSRFLHLWLKGTEDAARDYFKKHPYGDESSSYTSMLDEGAKTSEELAEEHRAQLEAIEKKVDTIQATMTTSASTSSDKTDAAQVASEITRVISKKIEKNDETSLPCLKTANYSNETGCLSYTDETNREGCINFRTKPAEKNTSNKEEMIFAELWKRRREYRGQQTSPIGDETSPLVLRDMPGIKIGTNEGLKARVRALKKKFATGKIKMEIVEPGGKLRMDLYFADTTRRERLGDALHGKKIKKSKKNERS